MACKICSSYAINHGHHGRDGTEPNLCDVCYWREKAKRLLEREKGLREAGNAVLTTWSCGGKSMHPSMNKLQALLAGQDKEGA